MEQFNRRDALALGLTGALSAFHRPVSANAGSPARTKVRSLFPGVGRGLFLNAAGGTPIGSFTEEGLRRYVQVQQTGSQGEWRALARNSVDESRRLFADLIGARESEIGLLHCTKAGEQLVIERLKALRRGGNIVTNDLHFSGSLHNLVGLRSAGVDVRVVRAKEWKVDTEAMARAIDDRTALVSISLVSNVNGHVEPIRELASIAHAHGAFVYADIIQAAGIVPIDVRDMGIDFAACSGYKWLYGVHGVGFFFAREEHQGTVLEDRSFPGSARHNYPPWVEQPDSSYEDFVYEPPSGASRYQPGHICYLGYCGLHEGLQFLHRAGVENALRHSVRLNRRLKSLLDPKKYECISPHLDRSPIATFLVKEKGDLRKRLSAGGVVASLGRNRLRISPAVYNEESEIDRLAEILE